MATARSAAKPADDKATNDKLADSKTADEKATSKNTTDGETKSDAKADEKATESYIDQAAKLATDVRALAEKMREDLTEVECRCA